MSITNDNPFESAEYDQFLLDMAKGCHARDKPCPGCCAGGMCDGDLGGQLSEDYEPDTNDSYYDEED